MNFLMSSINRRSFLRTGLAATAAGTAVASCSTDTSSSAAPAGAGLIGPDSPQVAAAQPDSPTSAA